MKMHIIKEIMNYNYYYFFFFGIRIYNKLIIRQVYSAYNIEAHTDAVI